MVDFTADHITTSESTALLKAAQEGLLRDFPELNSWEFVPGVSYRNLLLYQSKSNVACGLGKDLRTTAPHDRVNQFISDAFPRGTGSRLLTEIMGRSESWLKDHPVNQLRKQKGLGTATHVWLWGAGQRPAFETFKSLHGVQGTMITAVDLLRASSKVGWVAMPRGRGSNRLSRYRLCCKRRLRSKSFRIVTRYVFMLKPRMKRDMKVMHWPR